MRYALIRLTLRSLGIRYIESFRPPGPSPKSIGLRILRANQSYTLTFTQADIP